MTDDNRIRTAVVGAGKMGGDPRQGLQPVAPEPVDRRGGHATRPGRPSSPRSTTARPTPIATEILGQVDAVTIATPTTTHLQLAKPFLRRRIPVLIEKPLAVERPRGPPDRVPGPALRYRGRRGPLGALQPGRPGDEAVQHRAEVHRGPPRQPLPVPLDRRGRRSRHHDPRHRHRPVAGEQQDPAGRCRRRQRHRRRRGHLRRPDRRSRTAASPISPPRAWPSRPSAGSASSPARPISASITLKKTGIVIRPTPTQDVVEWIRAQQQQRGDFNPAGVNWTELVHIEPLEIDDKEPLRLEQEAFLRAVQDRSFRPEVGAEEGLAALKCRRRSSPCQAPQVGLIPFIRFSSVTFVSDAAS